MPTRGVPGLAGAFLLAACSLQAAVTHASWPANPSVNVPVCVSPGNQNEPRIVGDGAGGAIVLWLDDRSGTHQELRLQHVLETGMLDPNWPPEGLPVCNAAFDQMWPSMISDGAGGAFVVWSDVRNGLSTDIFAQHVLESGERDPAFPAEGYAVCSVISHQNMPVLVSDLAGGAIIAWQDHRADAAIYAQHLLASGVADPAWPPNGKVLCIGAGFRGSQKIVEDGAGGAIVSWLDSRGSNTDVYAQRILSSGALAPGWPVNGTAVCVAPGYQDASVLVSDGAGGALAAWSDPRSGSSNDDIYAQHILSGGTVDPSWPANGRALCTAPGRQHNPRCVTDGSGGALVVWEDERSDAPDLYAQRVLASGLFDAAWPVNGLAVSAKPGFQQYPSVVADGAGGAVVAWYDSRSSDTNIYATRFTAAGTIAPVWGDGGLALSTAPNSQQLPSSVLAGNGGVIVVWAHGRDGQEFDIYAQRVSLAGQLGTVSVPQADPGIAAVLSAPQPNPSSGAVSFRVTLPREGQVDLAIYEPGGRRVRSLLRGSRPAGEFTQLWDGRSDAGTDVQPGLYFARLESSGIRRVTRVVRLR